MSALVDRITVKGFINSHGYRIRTGQKHHPLADKAGRVSEHRMVLYDAIGPGPQACHWGCGRTELQWCGHSGITADHINGDKLDNRPENLVPSCARCNRNRAQAGNAPDWKYGELGTHCRRSHLFTEENTTRGGGRRTCRICLREQGNKRQREKRRAGDKMPKPGHVGSNSNYTRGCRCADCTAAHANYERGRLRRAAVLPAVEPKPAEETRPGCVRCGGPGHVGDVCGRNQK